MRGIVYSNGLERPRFAQTSGRPIPVLADTTPEYREVERRLRAYFERNQISHVSVREAAYRILGKFRSQSGMQTMIERQGTWDKYIGQTIAEIAAAHSLTA